MNGSCKKLDAIFRPRSVALVGITTANPEHWTRGFLEGYLKFDFPAHGRLYLVNPKGGKLEGLEVYKSIKDIPDSLDFVVGLVPSKSAPQLIKDSAAKGAGYIHFCTAGFSEIDEDEGKELESELLETARKYNVRIIGPNCLGVYCPKARMSFSELFPRESGRVGFISQSGGNSNYLIRQSALRGVRFSKVISIGNASDLNESDFLEYLAEDPETEVIAMYLEGIKNSDRFRKALAYAARKKSIVLLKGGATSAGARAVMGHTASIAGSRSIWQTLCRQLNIIQVENLDEMADMLVTLSFLPVPDGSRVLLFGGGGGSSVIIADEFERRGLTLPQLPDKVIAELREFSQAAGNFFNNPIDYSQSMEPANVRRALDILSRWGDFDLMVHFLVLSQSTRAADFPGGPLKLSHMPYPTAVVVAISIIPEETDRVYEYVNYYANEGVPVYFSYASAANAIKKVILHYRGRELHEKRTSEHQHRLYGGNSEVDLGLCS
ncbi:MAG: CoA-binding protein [Syntrophales bacterium]|jgi:acyl-CoA synthetase (NDP forming)|nr:CoA-binding protein [Syntrophales bacterium]MDY0044583.1 CoA-binding protein [Syntrophales bacterium]